MKAVFFLSFCLLAVDISSASNPCRDKACRSFLGDSCAEDGDCIVPNSRCQNEICECDSGFAQYISSCLKTCDTSNQCNDVVPASYCKTDSKVCLPKSSLGQACDTASTDSCAIENSECIPVDNGATTGTCECSPDHVEENGQCIPGCNSPEVTCDPTEFCHPQDNVCKPRLQLGDECFTEGDGECGGDNVVCKDFGGIFRCSCDTDFVEEQGQCKSKCMSNDDCDLNQFCSTSLGSCQPKLELGGWCRQEDTEPCKNPDVAECTNNKCTCKASHVNDNGRCVVKCTGNEDDCGATEFCHLASGLCMDKLDNGMECEEQEGEMEQCKDDNASCQEADAKLTCQCVQDYVNHDNVCKEMCKAQGDCPESQYCDVNDVNICMAKKPLGQSCSDSFECRTANSECVQDGDNKKCGCGQGFIESQGTCQKDCSEPEYDCPQGFYCHSNNLCQARRSPGMSCDHVDACVEHAECQNDRCKCDETSYENNRRCRLKCQDDAGCLADSEFCDALTGRCFEKVGLDNSCRRNEECLGPFTSCQEGENGKQRCWCIEGYVAVNGACSVESGDGNSGSSPTGHEQVAGILIVPACITLLLLRG